MPELINHSGPTVYLQSFRHCSGSALAEEPELENVRRLENAEARFLLVRDLRVVLLAVLPEFVPIRLSFLDPNHQIIDTSIFQKPDNFLKMAY